MPEWLTSSIADDPLLPLPVLLTRMALAMVFGLIVAGSYRLTQPRMTERSLSLMATLVLLTILIGMVTLTIGNSVARAFSLVGALSIVRFRTVVEDTRDTAFVIFAVAVGMAVGAGYLRVPLIGIPMVSLAAYLFRPRNLRIDGGSPSRSLTLRIGVGRDVKTSIEPVLQNYLDRWQLKSISTARQGSAFDLKYHAEMRSVDSAVELVSELNRVEGVQDVSLSD